MLKRYLLNTSGNFGIMFALFSTVLVLGLGVAVDFTGMTKQRTILQNYIDAAILAAATANTDDLTELQEIVDSHIAQLNTEGWTINAPVSFDGDDIVIDAHTSYETFLLGAASQLLGGSDKNNLPIGASTASPMLKDIPINVALVVDITDSMEGANMDALQAAARSLLQDLEQSDANIRVSLVPFGNYVNIEFAENESWLDTSDDGRVEMVNEEFTNRDILTADVCTPTGRLIPGKVRKRDGVVIGQHPDEEEISCSGATYGPEYTDFRNYQEDYTWHGCAGSRDNGDNDQAAFDGVQIPGVMEITRSGDRSHTDWARCGAEMIPLTDDLGRIINTVNGLWTQGNTYIPSGLMWGWRALTPEAPLTEAAANLPDTVSAIIFMTDGFNTLSQRGIRHDGWEQDAGVTLGATLCENIKNDGIHMYTVAYDIPTIEDAQATKTMLENCASNDTSSFTPDNAAQLREDFKEIGNNLRNVRLKYRPS